MPQASEEGYRLLWMLESYLQLDSLIGLDVHTEETLIAIETELISFGEGLQVCKLILNFDMVLALNVSRHISHAPRRLKSGISRSTGISPRYISGSMSYAISDARGLHETTALGLMKRCMAC
jgi:hypothetical protein